ncbi:hypothetical protein IEQ34_009294 [Dendrobium chrysotoxum]|uniref:Uncharacterized protein n=1 Tax=Dendrobium chrysotoxum TaxID=161865 RepID=A0AAV7H226_DENCH|nr:hypothetical protein IEQ34_009294 [Dendrobium chrysotoxum]
MLVEARRRTMIVYVKFEELPGSVPEPDYLSSVHFNNPRHSTHVYRYLKFIGLDHCIIIEVVLSDEHLEPTRRRDDSDPIRCSGIRIDGAMMIDPLVVGKAYTGPLSWSVVMSFWVPIQT